MFAGAASEGRDVEARRHRAQSGVPAGEASTVGGPGEQALNDSAGAQKHEGAQGQKRSSDPSRRQKIGEVQAIWPPACRKRM
jgi:hypothetical protein